MSEMKIYNDDNILAVKEFETKYSDKLIKVCPALKGLQVYFIDIDWDNIPAVFTTKYEKGDFDSPYSTDEINKKRYIFRSSANCAGYSTNEEIALIVHEFGHIFSKRLNINQHFVVEEIFCDSLSHTLGLSSEMVGALDNMIKSGHGDTSSLEDRKANAEISARSVSAANSVNTLDTFMKYVRS